MRRLSTRLIGVGLVASVVAAGLLGTVAARADDPPRQVAAGPVDVPTPPVGPFIGRHPSEPQPSEGAGQPAYVPAGARLAWRDRGTDGSGAVYYGYQLAGVINADTRPSGVPAPVDLAQHVDTELAVDLATTVHDLDGFPSDSEYDRITPVDIGGSRGVLLEPKRGFGTIRVDWVDVHGLHTVMCDWLKTDRGRSGVDTAELLKVARSID